MRPGSACAKYILFAFNLVFVIFGILLVVYGAQSIAQTKNIQDVIHEYPSGSAIALIGIGIAIFAIAFLGCCGAIKENTCMLNTFATIVLLLLIIEVIATGLTIMFKADMKNYAQQGVNELMDKYNWTVPAGSPMNQVVDDLQTSLKCCGAASYTDWDKHRPQELPQEYPGSCCEKAQNGTSQSYCSPSEVSSKRGCVDAMQEAIENSLYPLSGIGIAVAIAQLLGVLLACCLAREIKREYQVV